MATATKATAAPRKRTSAAKATPAKAAPAASEAPATGADVEVYVVELEQIEDTKSYARFKPPASSGCVGTFYAPLGTTEVKVKLTGPAA
jgi:hypothetical protein